MKDYFNSNELFEIRSALKETMRRKEESLARYNEFNTDHEEIKELIKNTEDELKDIKSAYEKIILL